MLFSGIALVLAPAGCKSPNKANIQLRKENQQLRDQVADLERRHAADMAQIRAMESAAGGNASATLPQDRLERLFTVHGLTLGRLTGVSPEGELKVYATPTEDSGHDLKAAGSFIVELFDLAKGDNARIGRWEFPLEQARKNWVGQALLHTYVLTCPWQTRPEHSELTLKVSFTDALTGRTFDTQKLIHVKLPLPASQPAPR